MILPECKKALIKTWVGAVLFIVAAVIVESGRRTPWLVAFCLLLLLGGVILFPAYSRCVARLNRRDDGGF